MRLISLEVSETGGGALPGITRDRVWRPWPVTVAGVQAEVDRSPMFKAILTENGHEGVTTMDRPKVGKAHRDSAA